ncbi:hypothetical protein JAAARDRAFT_165497 [Jaapia argillacea MUCL 33604]|uniref:Rab-GAP TBC domain-containing protein n=1 Tax=Jaapia argillacea MUCL 33604 TaxID=933084 RepID=A0A067P3X1_9AGAM|nr:hypothetical protein JAAARDRAFT_165497 [Jaapia argillacea MUCL 33604]
MDATQLARWTRFAAKGGIGKCTATQDCVAESMEDLMFMKDDEIIVLMQLPDREGWYLGYCEGVVGRFQATDVQFHGKLKKPVMTKRSSTTPPSIRRVSSTSKSQSPSPSLTNSSSRDAETTPSRTSMVSRPPSSSHLSLIASSSSSPQLSHSHSLSSAHHHHHSLPRARTISHSPSISLSRSESSRSHHLVLTDVRSSSPVPISPGEEGLIPPSFSYSSSSTGAESGLDTPLDSPAHFMRERKHPEEERERVVGLDPILAELTPIPTPVTVPITAAPSSSPPPLAASEGDTSGMGEESMDIEQEMHDRIWRTSVSTMASIPLSSHSRGSARHSQPPPLTQSPAQVMHTTPDHPSPLHQNQQNESRPTTPPAQEEKEAEVEGEGEESYADPSTRLSIAMSDGEVGIGLSLLQGMIGEGAGDDDSFVSESDYGDDRTGGVVGEGEDTISGFAMQLGLGAVGGFGEREGGFEDGGIEERERRDVTTPTRERESTEVSHTTPSKSHVQDPTPPTPPPHHISSLPPSNPANPTFTTPSPPSLSPPPPPSHSPPPAPPLSPPITDDLPPPNPDAYDPDISEEWEGASDIYDDYRYSRFSMASKMSRFSMMSRDGGFGGAGGVEVPPVPSDFGVGGWRLGEGVGSGSGRPSVGSSEGEGVPRMSMGGVLGESEVKEEGREVGEVEVREVGEEEEETSLKHQSVDSAYSEIAPDESLPPPEEPKPDAPSVSPLTIPIPTPNPEIAIETISSPTETSSLRVPPALDLSPLRPIKEDRRPAPLQLAPPSPLLHTDFGSPLPSPALVSPTPSSPGLLSPSLTQMQLQRGGGIASALRERLERDRVSPTPELEAGKERVGGRDIVVIDDEDEGPQGLGVDGREEGDRSSVLSASSSLRSPNTNGDATEVHSQDLHVDDSVQEVSLIPSLAPSPQPVSPHPQNPPIRQELRPTPSSSSQPRQPTQAEIKERHAFSRVSIFLPHPNAPKAPAISSGPMYGRQNHPDQPPPQYQPPVPPQNTVHGGTVIHTLHLAAAARFGPNGQPRQTTIYGMCRQDLTNSLGPVPIMFSLEPLQSIPANRAKPPGSLHGAVSLHGHRRPATAGSVEPLDHERYRVASPPAPVAPSVPAPEITPTPVVQEVQPAPAPNVIPRANFFPKAQTPRPRSRSFSGFDSSIAEISLPDESQRDSAKAPNGTGRQSVARAASASAVRSQQQPTPAGRQPASGRAIAHGPSPLSLPHNITTGARIPSPLRTPTLPPNRSPSPPQVESSNLATPSTPNFPGGPRQVSPNPALRPQPSSPPSGGPTALPLRISRQQSEHNESRSAPSPSPSSNGQANGADSDTRTSMHGRRSGDTDMTHYSDARSQMTSPAPTPTPASPPTRKISLRSKMSLPNLRTKNDSNLGLSGPPTPVNDQETIQVQDMDFELIRPTIPALVPSARTSEDSTTAIRASASGFIQDSSGLLRAESPALSMLSATIPRSPTSVSEASFSVPKAPSPLEGPAAIEAHRQRELKWISIMSSTPPSQARKSKKVKKLLIEGVPASVRSNVWQHLTDSKGKRMDGLYTQLGRRGRVAASNDIERDARHYFEGNIDLQGSQGPLLSLLQAYLFMVPDIQYHPGLTIIAGNLLQQSIEEDAFWIFVSLMDTHLRSYFASSSIQLEVDASLFSKALEVNDHVVAKRLFGDMGIAPATVCRPWFCAMFGGVLPPDFLHRVWDVFLYEGVIFLFRIGLALLSCCRRLISECPNHQAAVSLLMKPPPSCLPPTPDDLLVLAYSMKLKDDDLRKQRSKMEAQVKRQTQGRALVGISSSGGPQPPAISLPRS